MRRIRAIAASTIVLTLGFGACSSSKSASSHAPRTSTTQAPVLDAARRARINADLSRLVVDDRGRTTPKGESQADFHIQFGPSPHAPVPPAEQRTLDVQLAAARAFAVAHPTLRDAERDGYVPQNFVDGDGVHATNWDLVNEHFDPSRPSMVIYESTAPSAKIVALSYVTESIGHQPAGFAGPNDHWHQHFGLCVVDGVLAQKAFKNRPKCAALRGTYLSGTTLWMLHVWVVPGLSNRWGVFSLSNPDHHPAPAS